MENKRKFVKRKNFGVKTKQLSNNKNNRSLSISGNSSFDKSGLKRQNKILAATLNETRLQNAALCQKINMLNGDIMELRREVSELKKEKQTITATARAKEAELQQKFAVVINPIKSNLTKAFNYSRGMTDCLTSSMRALESLQNQTYQSQNRLSEELNSSWFQRSSAGLRSTPQATVSPRVSGHEIRKPKIRISRLNMSDLDANLPVNLAVPEPPIEATTEVIQDNEDEAEPLMIRSRRRRPPRENPSDLEPLEENTEEERNEEYILLYPRVVLDRIRVTPSRPSSAASRRQSSTNILEDSETPRARESFEDFTRTLSGIDPMEGPSWLFEESAQPTTKTREEKRKENSLKARYSSASKRLSLDNDNPLDNEEPTVQVSNEATVQPSNAHLSNEEVTEEQPEQNTEESQLDETVRQSSRRRGSRAAAAAARSSLKEPTLNSKLRQGDPSSTSVYDDFVPGTKRKSSSETKSKSTDAKSKAKRKKSNDKEDKNTK